MLPTEMPTSMLCKATLERKPRSASSASATSCTEVVSPGDSLTIRVKNTFLEFSVGQHSSLERFMLLRRAWSAPNLNQVCDNIAVFQGVAPLGTDENDRNDSSLACDDLENTNVQSVPMIRLADILKPPVPEDTDTPAATYSDDDLTWRTADVGVLKGKDSCSVQCDHALKSPVSTSVGSPSASDAEDVPHGAADFAADSEAERTAARSRAAVPFEASAAPESVAAWAVPPPTFGVLRLSDVLAQQRPDAAAGSPCGPAAAPPQPKAAVAMAAPAVLRLEDALGRALLGSPELPTGGSAGHHTGQCKPCTYVWRRSGCHNGVGCVFCHLCPPGELNRRKKVLRRLGRLAAPAATASTAWLQRRELGRKRVPEVNAASH